MSKAIWHDLECGSYTADLTFWRALAQRVGGPVLDVGAGTGRTALALAREGHEVVAIDHDDELLGELRERAAGLEVTTIVADARAFWLDLSFPLIIVPMQTIQLLGGAPGRAGFLECAAYHLESPGVLAVAVAVEHTQQGQDRDRGHVLEQQDAEGGAAMTERQLLLLAQHLQDERGGREGETETGDERRHQAQA